MVVKEASYEVTDPSVESQVLTLAGAGADTFINVTTPKFAAQAIRKAYDIGWKPLQFLASTTQSIPAVLEPAGIEKSVGIVSLASFKQPGDPAWDNDPGMQDYFAAMKKWSPEHSATDYYSLTGYATAQLAAIILKNSGDELEGCLPAAVAAGCDGELFAGQLRGFQQVAAGTLRRQAMAGFFGRDRCVAVLAQEVAPSPQELTQPDCALDRHSKRIKVPRPLSLRVWAA